MRISDWISDVCSSDLTGRLPCSDPDLDRFKLRCGKYLCANSNDPGEKWFERAVALDRHRADLVEQDRRMAITPRPRGAAVVAAKSPKPAPGILLIDADTVGKVTQTRARCCLGWCAAAPAIGAILDDIRQNIRTCAMGRVHHFPKRVGAERKST